MFLTLTCFDENDNDFNFWNTCLYGNCSVLFLFLSNNCIWLFDKRPNININSKCFLLNHILGGGYCISKLWLQVCSSWSQKIRMNDLGVNQTIRIFSDWDLQLIKVIATLTDFNHIKFLHLWRWKCLQNTYIEEKDVS